jgi:hypothetical protein
MSPSQGRYLHTGQHKHRLNAHRTAQTQTKRTQTSMPRVGFEPTTPMLERVKIVHAADRVATVIGVLAISYLKLYHI